MTPASSLDRLVQALVSADPKERPDAAIKKAGLSEAEVIALCQRPDAVPALLSAAFARHAVPILPGLVARLAERAARGDAKAEDVILGFLGGRSPLREHLNLDPSKSSDQGLKDQAKQLAQQLLETFK